MGAEYIVHPYATNLSNGFVEVGESGGGGKGDGRGGEQSRCNIKSHLYIFDIAYRGKISQKVLKHVIYNIYFVHILQPWYHMHSVDF